jgi:hypothetical protein
MKIIMVKSVNALFYLCLLTSHKAIVLKYVHNGTFSLHGGQTLSYTVSGAVTKRKVGVWMTGSFVFRRKSKLKELNNIAIPIQSYYDYI